MIRRFISFTILICILFSLSAFVGATYACPTEYEVFQRITAMKDTYPEGLSWTNDNKYNWSGGLYSGGSGCVAFAYAMSDAAFGTLPARKIESNISLDTVRVGDILRIDNNSHSVIVLKINSDHAIIAEGNYNKSVHWGRKISADTVASAKYIMTRYPKDPRTLFIDIPGNA